MSLVSLSSLVCDTLVSSLGRLPGGEALTA
jgi:hypothetical protein